MSLPDHSAAKHKLPIGVQTFRKIREGGYYYVDKTPWIGRLVDEGKYYVLARPRRFGKSLLLDTVKELFEGSEELFRGLAIHDQWDWNVRRPVVRLSFGAGPFDDPGLAAEDAMDQLYTIERETGIEGRYDTASARFDHLLQTLHERSGQRVAVLVDEYDKPILDVLDKPEAAKANQSFLSGLYSTVKSCDAHIQFTLLTGVTRFSTAGIFSGLNNLINISLDPRYSAICGFTEADLDSVFAPELPGLDRDEIRRWYYGYSWRSGEKLYNPFDILPLFDTREFRSHWSETGSPKFLIDNLIRRGLSSLDLDCMVGDESLLSSFEVEKTDIETLLFQTGYLTVLDEKDRNGFTRYRLGYPNQEVRQNLNEHMLMALLPHDSMQTFLDSSLRKLLAANDFAGLEALFRDIFAGIPYQWHVKNAIQEYEDEYKGYYASVIYSCFAAQGFDLMAEDSPLVRPTDMTVRFDGAIYVFGFKTVEEEPTGEAMAQLKARGYADKYRSPGQPVHLIGVEFSKADRNIAAFDVERVS